MSRRARSASLVVPGTLACVTNVNSSPASIVEVIRYPHRASVFHPRHHTGTVEGTLFRRNVCGKHIFFAIGLGDLFGSGPAAAAERVLLPSPLQAGTLLLTLLFTPQRVRFLKSLRRKRTVTVVIFLSRKSHRLNDTKPPSCA